MSMPCLPRLDVVGCCIFQGKETAVFKKLVQTSIVLGMLVFPATAGAYVKKDGTEVCPGQTFEQAFAAFGDKRQYTALPNGDFESGLTGWEVTGGAEVEAHENPFRPTPGASALFMPAGSSVTSPALCVSKGYPSARLFAQKLSGKGGSGIEVEVLYPPRDKGKGSTVKKAGLLKGWDAFAPSRSFSIGQGRIGRGTAMVRFRLTVKGNASFLVDDLLVDPRCRH